MQRANVRTCPHPEWMKVYESLPLSFTRGAALPRSQVRRPSEITSPGFVVVPLPFPCFFLFPRLRAWILFKTSYTRGALHTCTYIYIYTTSIVNVGKSHRADFFLFLSPRNTEGRSFERKSERGEREIEFIHESLTQLVIWWTLERPFSLAGRLINDRSFDAP